MTTLYRIYGRVDERDQNGLGPISTRLLYVGITDDYDRRIAQHTEKRWWMDIVKVTREEFADRRQAADAERRAIEQEAPLHNKAMNRGAAKQRVVTPPRVERHAERDPLLGVAEAADYLGVCTKTLRGYISSGDLPASRIKGSRLIRVRVSALDALLRPIPSAKVGELA